MQLNTIEQFLILAQHPTKGKFAISEVYVNYGLIGAILLELASEGNIVLRDGKLFVKDTHATHPTLREILVTIHEAKRERKIKYWVDKLSHKSRRFKRTFINDLAEKQLFKIEEKKFLGVFPYKLHYLINHHLREQIMHNARKDVLNNNAIGRENLILGLIEACKMHKFIAHDKRELKTIKKSLKEMVKESQIAETIDKTIEEVQSAMVAAIIAASVASTTASVTS